MHEVRKFRKRPVVVEAMYYDGTEESFNRLFDWMCPSGDASESPVCCGNKEDGSDDFNTLWIDTLEGEEKIRGFYWIIKGIKGEFYACRPDIFGQTYEDVER